jgi:hypothetical protein
MEAKSFLGECKAWLRFYRPTSLLGATNRNMRDWPNPAFEGTLEQACAAAPRYPDVSRIALEVVDETGRRAVLAAAYDSGLPPWSGDLVRCSDLSFERLYRVERVGLGHAGRMRCGRYPFDFTGVAAPRDRSVVRAS